MTNRFLARRVTIFALLAMTIAAHPSFAITRVTRSVIILSNTLSVLGGIGLFSAATIDVIQVRDNSTELNDVKTNVAASSFLSFAIGSALSIVASELCGAKLVNKVDEVAIAMTSLGFSVLSAGIWSNNLNAILAGSVTVSSFFASRALLLPLLIAENPNSFRPSDKVLLAALTMIGNVGGLLLTWSSFEPYTYRRQLLQAGAYIIGIINPVVFTGLTINLFRTHNQAVAPNA